MIIIFLKELKCSLKKYGKIVVEVIFLKNKK